MDGVVWNSASRRQAAPLTIRLIFSILVPSLRPCPNKRALEDWIATSVVLMAPGYAPAELSRVSFYCNLATFWHVEMTGFHAWQKLPRLFLQVLQYVKGSNYFACMVSSIRAASNLYPDVESEVGGEGYRYAK